MTQAAVATLDTQQVGLLSVIGVAALSAGILYLGLRSSRLPLPDQGSVLPRARAY